MAEHVHITPDRRSETVSHDTRRRSSEAASGALDRRQLGAGLFAIIVGSGITAGAAASVADLVPDSPDSELIALCTSAEAAENRSWAVWDAVVRLPPGDAGLCAAYDKSNRVYNVCRDGMIRATVMSPSTPAGWRAKASLALLELAAEDEDALPLVRSVLMQLAGRA